MSSPNFTGRVDFYGMPNLKVGLSGYFGDSQSKTPGLDSTVVSIAMFGGDVRYTINNLELRGQYVMISLDNTENYNLLTENDLGSLLTGYYIELGYNILPNESDNKLITFIRYENYNTHAKTEGLLEKNLEYDRTETTIGLSYKVSEGSVFKADYQIKSNALNDDYVGVMNLGIGWWF